MLAVCKAPNYESSVLPLPGELLLPVPTQGGFFKAWLLFLVLFSLRPEQSEAQVTEVPKIVTLLAGHHLQFCFAFLYESD